MPIIIYAERLQVRRVSFRLSLSCAVVACLLIGSAVATPITYEEVTVGNPGNANDTGGTFNGAVNYAYQIGKYDVTIGQYAAFLNAADPNGTNPNGIYNSAMETDLTIAGISYTSGASAGSKYSVIGPSGTAYGQTGANRPITYVSWFDAARFANWMTNGQGAGSTETGAYTLGGATSGNAVAANPGAAFYIPTENQWYKAAYYDPTLNSGAGGYYAYATQSDTAPGNLIGSTANQANYAAGQLFSVSQSGTYDANQNYLTDVGAFSGGGSFYGTFDQSGNVYQWNDLDGTPGSSRGRRGGQWGTDNPLLLSSSSSYSYDPSLENRVFGFRLASPVIVPEPSTWVMGLAGIACGGYTMLRRRKRA